MPRQKLFFFSAPGLNEPTPPPPDQPVPTPHDVLPCNDTTVRALHPTAFSELRMLPRGPFVLPGWNARCSRITVDEDGDLEPVSYSYWRNINAHQPDDTIMFAFLCFPRARGGDGMRLFAINKESLEVIKLGPIFKPDDPLSWHTGDGCYFSAVDRHLLYIPHENRLLRYNISNGRTENIIFLENGKIPFQCHSSDDDQVHSCTVQQRDGERYQKLGSMVANDQRQIFIPAVNDHDECQVDRSGEWLLIKENVDMREGEDNRVIHLSNIGRELVINDRDGAVGHSDMGRGYFVGENNFSALPSAMFKYDLSRFNGGPVVSPRLIYYGTDWAPGLGHVSHTNVQGHFVVVSCASRSNAPRANEIIQVPLNSNIPQFRPLAPNLSTLDDDGIDPYRHMPKGNLDISGQYFIWTGNLGRQRHTAFIVRVPAW